MLRGCLAGAGARLVAENGEVGKREKCVAPAPALTMLFVYRVPSALRIG